MSIEVLVVGGGIGGLCLAQGLRRAGIGVHVYEHDVSIAARGQGYRFRMDPGGETALRECLPPNLYALYQAAANKPSPPPIGAFDCNLNLTYRLEKPAHSDKDKLDAGHLAVERATLCGYGVAYRLQRVHRPTG